MTPQLEYIDEVIEELIPHLSQDEVFLMMVQRHEAQKAEDNYGYKPKSIEDYTPDLYLAVLAKMPSFLSQLNNDVKEKEQEKRKLEKKAQKPL